MIAFDGLALVCVAGDQEDAVQSQPFQQLSRGVLTPRAEATA